MAAVRFYRVEVLRITTHEPTGQSSYENLGAIEAPDEATAFSRRDARYAFHPITA